MTACCANPRENGEALRRFRKEDRDSMPSVVHAAARTCNGANGVWSEHDPVRFGSRMNAIANANTECLGTVDPSQHSVDDGHGEDIVLLTRNLQRQIAVDHFEASRRADEEKARLTMQMQG